MTTNNLILSGDEPASIAPQPPEAATPAPSPFHVPNADGIFESAEEIYVPLSAGNICHFLLAHAPGGWIGGHKFFTRQPKNHVHNLPRVTALPASSRDEALALCVESALLFFSQHGTALARLSAWAREHLPLLYVVALEDSLIVGKFMVRAVPSEAAVVASEAPAPVPAAALPSPVTQTPEVTDGSEPQPLKAHYAEIPLADIARGHNPRRQRDPKKFSDLVESLRTSPLLQPIAVRDLGEGREGKRYEIIFGEGRYLAYMELERPTIEARVWSGVDAGTVKAWALVENLQREEMNAMDEGEGFADLANLGWSPARMAEETGKTTRTIRRAIALTKLPESIREDVRSGELSARQARELVSWVVPPGFEDEAEHAAFKPMPRVAEIIASVARKCQFNIPSDQLAGREVPPPAYALLREEKLIVEIPAKYAGRVGNAIEHYTAPFGEKYTFDLEGWKALKKQIDAEDKEAEKRAAEKAQAKVASRVNVPVVDLKKAKEKFYEMKAAEEIFADYLPPGVCVPGIGESGAEVMLCLKPDLLAQLKIAAERATAAHNAMAIELIEAQAIERIRWMKKVGAHDLSLLLAYGGLAYVTSTAWRGQGVKVPAKWMDDNRNATSEIALMRGLDPVTVCRLGLHSALTRARGTALHHEILGAIMETDKFGLASEDPQFLTRLLEKLSGEIFPKEPAFGGFADGNCVDFPTREDAVEWVETQRGRAGFADYETKIEKQKNGTFTVRYEKQPAKPATTERSEASKTINERLKKKASK